MEGELKNLTIFTLSVIASLCYCYLLPSTVPKGKLRLLSLLPILSLFTFLPLLLSYAFTTAIAFFFITWLTNFKLLLFAFDLGPLSSPKPKSLLVFLSTASLPIKIRSTEPDIPSIVEIPNKSPLILAAEILIFAVLMTVMNDYRERIHPKLVLVMYCCLMYLLIDVMVAIATIVLMAMVGGELERPSDEPYLSNSLQEFWGRRWNLMASNALRCTIYEPVRSTSATLLGDRRWATVPAVMATFIVSGLMHELLFYYATRVPPTWEMTCFFVLHGACVVVETVVKGKGKLLLPWYVRRPLTVAFVAVTGFWLFFPPLTRCGADVMVLGEFQLFLELVKSELMKLLYTFVGQS